MPRRPLSVVAILLALGGGVTMAGPAQAVTKLTAAPRCAIPTGGPVIADAPWPQRRYDLTALSQITDGRGVTVAVLDSGVDTHHPQLAGAVARGADMLAGGDGREDCRGHGTAVASVIAARPMAGAGPRGLAPGATIVPVRVSERVATDRVAAGTGDLRDLAQGIRAAVALRAGIINLSISTTVDDPALRSAVRAALDAGIVVVAAVGNGHGLDTDPLSYPAAYDGVVGVGAIGEDGLRLPESQIGSYVDITAPGDGVAAATPGGGHAVFQGTSFATPFVAATAALIRSRFPDLGRDEVVRRLLATADPAPGPAEEYGHGIVNPLRAVTDVVPPAAAAVEPAGLGPPPAGRDPRPHPTAGVLALAGSLMLIAAGAGAIALALPAARRRRWRPGA